MSQVDSVRRFGRSFAQRVRKISNTVERKSVELATVLENETSELVKKTDETIDKYTLPYWVTLDRIVNADPKGYEEVHRLCDFISAELRKREERTGHIETYTQRQTSMEELYHVAEYVHPTFNQWARSLKQLVIDETNTDTSLEVVTSPLKGKARAKKKVECDYKGKWHHLKDVCRLTILHDNFSDLAIILRGLVLSLNKKKDSQFRVVRIQNRYKEINTRGYADIKILVRSNLNMPHKHYLKYKPKGQCGETAKDEKTRFYATDHVCEVLFKHRCMAAKKGVFGHAHYEVARAFRSSIDKVAKMTHQEKLVDKFFDVHDEVVTKLWSGVFLGKHAKIPSGDLPDYSPVSEEEHMSFSLTEWLASFHMEQIAPMLLANGLSSFNQVTKLTGMQLELLDIDSDYRDCILYESRHLKFLNKMVCIKSTYRNQYLAISEDGSRIDVRSSRTRNTKWNVVDAGDHMIAFQSLEGSYLAVSDVFLGKDLEIKTQMDPSCKFRLLPTSSTESILLILHCPALECHVYFGEKKPWRANVNATEDFLQPTGHNYVHIDVTLLTMDELDTPVSDYTSDDSYYFDFDEQKTLSSVDEFSESSPVVHIRSPSLRGNPLALWLQSFNLTALEQTFTRHGFSTTEKISRLSRYDLRLMKINANLWDVILYESRHLKYLHETVGIKGIYRGGFLGINKLFPAMLCIADELNEISKWQIIDAGRHMIGFQSSQGTYLKVSKNPNSDVKVSKEFNEDCMFRLIPVKGYDNRFLRVYSPKFDSYLYFDSKKSFKLNVYTSKPAKSNTRHNFVELIIVQKSNV